MADANDGIIVDTYNDYASNFYIRLRDQYSGNQDLYLITTANQWSLRYFKFERFDGSNATLKIYSDSARTALIDTLTITCDLEKKRYLYALASRDGGGGDTISGKTQNFEILQSHSSSSTSSSSVSWQPYENLLSYTEFQSPVYDITITTPLSASFDTMRGDAISYVYEDFGPSAFGNFDIDFEVRIDDISGDEGLALICGVSNTHWYYGDMSTANDGIMVFAYGVRTSFQFYVLIHLRNLLLFLH